MPVACAAASVWQPAQPALVKMAAPAVGSPFSEKAGVIGACGAAGSLADDRDRRRADDALGPAAGEQPA